jgi:hypothetical protein
MFSRKFFRLTLLSAAGLLHGPLAISQILDEGAPQELLAKRRVFESVGAGLRSIRRDARGQYYILTAPGPAVLVFDAQGKRVRQVPPHVEGSPGSSRSSDAIEYGEGLDTDADGRVYVADRGADLVRVFDAQGTASLRVPVSGPTSVAALGDGEFAVATAKSAHLVTVYDQQGKILREFGDPAEVAERPDLNRFLNIGRLATDAHGHIYYCFAYLPEPTVRRYDRHGYASLSIEVHSIDLEPQARAMRREIRRQERGGTPAFKPVVTALGIDPEGENIWISLGDELLLFDQEGVQRSGYRVYTPEGARLEPVTILIEPERLLVGADPLGLYEFPRPDKQTHQ